MPTTRPIRRRQRVQANAGRRRAGLRPRGAGAERLQRLVEVTQQITHIGSWEWNVGNDTVSWTAELYRIYGLEPQSLPITFAAYLERVHPDDRDRVRAAVRDAVRERRPFHHDERILRADGAVRVLDSRGEPIVDDSGRVVALIGTCLDVTETREREKALALSEDVIRGVTTGLTLWRLDDPENPQTLRLIGFNPAGARLARIDFAPLVGRTIGEAVPRAVTAGLPRRMAEVALSQRPMDLGLLPNNEGGISSVCGLKAFPLPDRGVGVAAENVTDILRTQEALRDAEAHYRFLVESVHAIVWRADARSFQFTFVSRSAEALLGYPVQSWTSDPAFWRDTIHPEDRDWAISFCRRATSELRDHQYEYRMIAADGRVVWLRNTVSVMAENGQARELVGVMVDVTDQHRASEDLHHSQERLQDLSAHLEAVREDERAALAREIHDNLGQALTALKIDLSWLSFHIASDGGRPRNVVQERIEEMRRLLDGTIDGVRRISSDLRPGVLDDLGLLAAVEWQAQEFERRAGIHCAVRSTLPDGRLDRRLSTGIFRILQEVLTNVARHAHARSVEIALLCESGRLVLEVRDDGVGITPEDGARPDALGLLGMRERARHIGGHIVFEGAPGRGTTVRLTVLLPPKREEGRCP
jgi:PAS domain S-box-containing protein